MNIIKYFIQSAITIPLLYLIMSSMIEFRYSRKKCITYIVISILITFGLDILLFHKGVNSILIYTFGPLTIVIPSFICLFLLAKHRNMSFIFVYLCETVLASITTSISYIVVYYIPGGNWLIQCILHIVLLLTLYYICKCYISEKLISTINNYKIAWNLYIILPISYLLIWNLFISISAVDKGDEHAVQIPYTVSILPSYIPVLFILLAATFYAIILVMSIIVKNYSFFREQEQKNALQFQITSLKNLQLHYDEKNESLRIYRHDMRHHFKNITLLLENGSIEKAKEYLNNISDTLTSTETISYCSNPIINSLLSYYNEKCHEDLINFECYVQLNENSLQNILDTELGAVISNILENSLHAVQKISKTRKRFISFKLLHRNHQYILKCENNFCDQIFLSRDGRPIAKQEGHGFGTQSIMAFEKKYQATTTYKINNNKFSICLLFSD